MTAAWTASGRARICAGLLLFLFALLGLSLVPADGTRGRHPIGTLSAGKSSQPALLAAREAARAAVQAERKDGPAGGWRDPGATAFLPPPMGTAPSRVAPHGIAAASGPALAGLSHGFRARGPPRRSA